MMLDVTIVICTYKRNWGARKALLSAINQDFSNGLSAEIVLVDNNPDGLALKIMKEFSLRSSLEIRYVREAVANISRARNAGIRAARGQFVAFLDDDEVATPGWIHSLFRTARLTAADLVFGPVRPVFEDGTPPPWDPTGSRYGTGLSLPDGAIAPILGEFGHARRLGVVGAGNVLIGRACLDGPEPFDPAFGSCGGEDGDFFRRQISRGRRAAWSQQAIVYEYVPRERTELAFMLHRTFRESQVFVNVLAKNSYRPQLTKRMLELRGAIQAALWAIPCLFFPILPRELAVRARFGFARGTGKLLWRRVKRSRISQYN